MLKTLEDLELKDGMKLTLDSGEELMIVGAHAQDSNGYNRNLLGLWNAGEVIKVSEITLSGWKTIWECTKYNYVASPRIVGERGEYLVKSFSFTGDHYTTSPFIDYFSYKGDWSEAEYAYLVAQGIIYDVFTKEDIEK